MLQFAPVLAATCARSGRNWAGLWSSFCLSSMRVVENAPQTKVMLSESALPGLGAALGSDLISLKRKGEELHEIVIAQLFEISGAVQHAYMPMLRL